MGSRSAHLATTLNVEFYDHDGRIVNNLTPDDFLLKEDDIQQKILYFSREANLPLTVGLLVDTSRSQRGVLEEERSASNTFLDQVLREGKDQAFVVHFDERVETLQGPTSSPSQLASALGQLSIPEGFATLIYSAIQKSSENLMRGQSGRKALILLTDGVAYKDPISIGTAIEFAQRADTIIYSIRFSDPIPFAGLIRAGVRAAAKEHGKLELERMAKETGGVLRGHEEPNHRINLLTDRGCTSQPIRYRLYARVTVCRWKVSQD